MKTPILRLAGLALALAAIIGGCRQQTPEQAFSAWVAALRSGDHQAAWRGLCRPTREQLETFVARATPAGAESRPAREVIFEQGLLKNVREIVRIDVLTQSGGRAVLEVTDEVDQKQQVPMVYEEERWCVELALPAPH